VPLPVTRTRDVDVKEPIKASSEFATQIAYLLLCKAIMLHPLRQGPPHFSLPRQTSRLESCLIRRETEYRKVDLVRSALEHGFKACAEGRTRGVAHEIADQQRAFIKQHQTHPIGKCWCRAGPIGAVNIDPGFERRSSTASRQVCWSARQRGQTGDGGK
jgi:hypothetical protein